MYSICKLQWYEFLQLWFSECIGAEVNCSYSYCLVFCQVTLEKQCVRLQLSVLNWNTPARDFYAANGAQDLTVSEGWHFIRFDGLSLHNLAKEAPKH